MNKEKKVANTQTSLAGGGINEEEKLWQAKKTQMKRKYRLISFLLIGIIIVSVMIYLSTAQKCLVWGHDWLDATCTEPKTCASCAVSDGMALGHSWPAIDELAYCTICNHPNGRLVNISNDVLVSFWSEQTLELVLENGRKSNPAILLTNSTVEKCYSLTLCLRIEELSAGNVLGEWGFYIRDLSGEWHLADTFNLSSDYVEAHFAFDDPISFDAWACPCHVLGDNWNFSFSVWLQDATVFEHNG